MGKSFLWQLAVKIVSIFFKSEFVTSFEVVRTVVNGNIDAAAIKFLAKKEIYSSILPYDWIT